ncbi:Hypothetical predicted protein [Octopus vulgaris]|uniref:Uncharacterized protein n=1 Tax=Octopus vulgaris TaxID=6645 RepID=A0AA36EXR7_OCTVU|nr:Hypothetical predicted protein [Octopus vulgaris]
MGIEFGMLNLGNIFVFVCIHTCEMPKIRTDLDCIPAVQMPFRTTYCNLDKMRRSRKIQIAGTMVDLSMNMPEIRYLIS